MITTPTARSSAIFYFGSFANSFGRYLFHLILLRLLTPGDYGEFLSYLSLMYLLSVPTNTIASIITKYVAEFRGQKDDRAINLFFYYLVKIVSPVTLVIGSFLIIFSSSLAVIFKAHPLAFVVLGISMFISLISAIIRSYISAFHRFVFQTWLGFIDVLLTIILAVFFIHLGWGPTGVVIAQLLAGIIGTILAFINIRSFIWPMMKQTKAIKFSLTGFTGFSLIYSFGFLSLISSDVLLVRHFFDTTTSGLYSSLSILGRMLYFGLSPLLSLVIPIAAHRHAATGNSKTVFYKLGSVFFILGLGATTIFTLFPQLIVHLLSGSNYSAIAHLLPFVAFTMFLLSLNQFIVSYLMAIGRANCTIILLIISLAQIILIYLIHSSISQIITINLILEIILIIGLSIYFYLSNFSKD